MNAIRKIRIKWQVWCGKAIDIWSKRLYSADVLNNLHNNRFCYDGIECGSMEVGLQSLKQEDAEKQRQVCRMTDLRDSYDLRDKTKKLEEKPIRRKKLIYLHGFGSSAASGTVKTLRKLLPDFDVVAPDISVDPAEALPFLRCLCMNAMPDVVVGTSMGGMYAQQMLGYNRICVNPAFEMSKKSKMLTVGIHEYFKPRKDGTTHFEITPEIIRHHAEMEKHQFDGITEEDRKQVWGMFADNDQQVNGESLFLQYYNQVIHFSGEHRMDDKVIEDVLVPLIYRCVAK